MKKLLSVVLAFALIVCAVPFGAFTLTASAETSGITGDCTWTLDGTTLTISGNGRMGNYSYNSKSPWGESITEVIINSGVTSIGSYAFYDCSRLISVTIPDSVTSIDWHAFSGCSSLTSINIPDRVKSIGDYAFYGCSLTSVTIPNSVTSIGDCAFYYCSSLTSVTIGNGVTSIGSYAFYGCSSLASINIPDSVTSIGGSAFRGCSSLESITFPFVGGRATANQYLGYIFGASSYSDNSSYVPSSLKTVIISDKCTSIGDRAFYGCNGLTSITIPDSVTSIGDYAFLGCSRLTSITIPDGVKSIGTDTFRGCGSLRSITIPNSVTSIGDYAFLGCSNLTDVYYTGSKTEAERISIESNNENLKNAEWHYYSVLSVDDVFTFVVLNGEAIIIDVEKSISGNITIPSTLGGYPVTSIGDYAFYNCHSLTSITIPDSVTSIGEYAFYECSSLTSITIPDSVTSIGNDAFNGCSSLASITIPDSVTSIGLVAFYNTAYYNDENNWENKVLYIGKHLIDAKGDISGEYSIKTGTLTIASSAFSYCTDLTNITIPNSVTSIGDYTFYYCTRLTSITMPDSVKSIGWGAFYYCESLTEVYYTGTKQDRENIKIGDQNWELYNATWHYNKLYPDAASNAWYSEAVKYVSENGIMSGYSNGKFGTSDSIKRQDFLVMLARLDGVNLDNYKYKSSFPDVARNSYYEAAVNWGVQNGIVTGYQNGKFGVGDKVTREQLVTFLYRYADYKGYDSDYSSNRENVVSRQYKDYKNVSGFAKQPILWAIEKGVISGKTSSTIASQGNAQRCEVAKIMYNIYLNDIFN